MSYMLLIIEPPEQRRTRTEAEGREAYARMQRFGEGLRAQGKLLAVESLASQPARCAYSSATARRNCSTAPSPRPRKWSAASS